MKKKIPRKECKRNDWIPRITPGLYKGKERCGVVTGLNVKTKENTFCGKPGVVRLYEVVMCKDCYEKLKYYPPLSKLKPWKDEKKPPVCLTPKHCAMKGKKK